ncbi:SDR family NAD(P)-dependent oxidoreductase [Conexibacter sp. CPCC 206217]|uniref:SDR family NAD(P)-dependent oxidoreductase n=1 Tax=Conexibacter sp. CPCC 206217 TaxID=3064574 RepID=UPI00271F257C|nr:SDR family NAD(P)-dependent oxidoreductase [Conexibacter sp. CPCC 206217]MDO8212059.1 SDR family NAD(P)-dependent oxidoreductase [Conexibacter sp. CPCC 206217]
MSGGRLAGRVAFISGTAGGQGRAAALLFAREGAAVFGCDLDAEGSEETLRLVRAEGGTIASLHPLDLTEEDGPRRWIAAGVERFGRIDVLYNNASTAIMRRIEDDDAWSSWRYTIRGELDLVFATIVAAWPQLVAQDGTVSIVNTSSTAALRGLPLPIGGGGSCAAHSAAKAGVLALTRQAAAEGAAHGIRCNAVLPGLIEAPVTAPIFAAPGARERIAASVPLRRVGQPEDVAFAALYFACEESAWVTGQTLVVDGGTVSIVERD